MKIAYMHFHLKTGGVATVIRQQVEALKGKCDVVALADRPPASPFPCQVLPIAGLGYDSERNSRMAPEQTAADIIRAIHAHWEDGCDILHVHNPTIAKNKHYLKILKLLKDSGLRLFLQIHDFAEDGRPTVYFEDDYISDCHYGVINSRDYDILIKSGLKPQGLHLVSNMVTPLPAPATGQKTGGKVVIPAQAGIQGTASDHARTLLDSGLRRSDGYAGHVLYPIRAIRRKNIGEAILLACFLPEKAPLFITLPPNSPADFPAYESWKRFVSRHTLNVEFEAGLKNDFTALVHSAGSLLTTSISEGFGFSFMEPWTAGKFLWGRDLPGITVDYKKNGIALDHLYTQIRTPLEWVAPEGFFLAWQKAVVDSLQSFGLGGDRFNIREEFDRLTADGTIDFGLLNEKFQQVVIHKILKNGENKRKFYKLNHFLADCGRVPTSGSIINKNHKLVKSRYSSEVYRSTLMSLYASVLACEPVQSIDKEKLLNEFFKFDNFSLLKWGRHDT